MPLQQDGSLIVGVPRPKYNPIINRMHSEVGKGRVGSMPHTRNPEYADYTYGAPTKTDAETAGTIMFNWPKPKVPKTEIDHGRDFLKLNKMSCAEGRSKPRDVSDWRASHDARIVTKPGDLLKLKNQVPVDLDRSKVWGAPTSTQPGMMNSLLTHTFEHEWVQEQIQKEEKLAARQARRQARKQQNGNISIADSSADMDSSRASVAESYTMKKFRNVPSRLHTQHRSTPEPTHVNRMQPLDHATRSQSAPGFRGDEADD